MNCIRRNWYNIGLIVAIGTITYSIFVWKDMGILQRLLLMNFVAILIHQFEEYGWPGGFPAIMNMVLKPSPSPERYPLNQSSSMILNVLTAYVFYLIPVFFPNVIWFGLAPVMLGILQFVVHGIITNRKLRSLYNPGLAAVIFLHIPIGIYYIYYIISSGIVSIWSWVIAALYMVFYQFIFFIKMNFTWLPDKNSRFPFNKEEMARFNVQKKIEGLNKDS